LALSLPDQPASPTKLGFRLPELDGLRGCAILLVVIWHYVSQPANPAPGTVLALLVQPFKIAWSGVDLFFVLSGFLIGGILLDHRSSPRYFKTFYIRRICRIFPLYYFWIALYLLIPRFWATFNLALTRKFLVMSGGLGHTSSLCRISPWQNGAFGDRIGST
jgi:peptidoglycan/LPS O-acetylase OafA/YrhL